MDINAQFLREVGVTWSSDKERDRLIEQVKLVQSTVEQVRKDGRRAKLPKGWSYNGPMHELTVKWEGGHSLQMILDAMIEKKEISVTEWRRMRTNQNLILSLTV